MIYRILLITAIIFLSEISFCQSTDSLIEAERIEAAKKEAARKEAEKTEAAKKEAARKEAEKKEAAKKEAARKEAEKKEAERKEAEKKETTEKEKREAAEKEAARKEAEKKEAERKEAARKETERKEAERKETERKEAEIQKQKLPSSNLPNGVVWLISGVVVLTAAANFLLLKNQASAIENRLKGQMNKSYQGVINTIKEVMANNGQQLVTNPVPVPVPAIPPLPDLPPSYIKTEIILSAGPRKDSANNDTELGEDIAGSISLPGKTYFWILDGTSDNTIIKGLEINQDGNRHEEYHIFSSRVLAQSLGHFIQKNIYNYDPEKTPLNELMTNAGKQVSEEWEKRLNNQPAEKKESILQAIGKGYKPICSTTVIVGCLYENGYLYALRTGDSKIFPFKKSGNEITLQKNFKFTSDPTDENDRIAFRLDFDETANAFVIKQNTPKWLTQSAQDIHSVFAFTDGIGRITEAQLASDNPGIVEMIRQSIARIPQKTHDDKTLIILERINTIG